MLTGEELIQALTILPEYDELIQYENEAVRLICLSDLYKIYLPSQMSVEIYSKLYLALLRSLQKKSSKLSVQQQYQNYNAVKGKEHEGILGGSDSFSIIGTSGIGKSSAISRAVELLSSQGVIETKEPYSKIIPCLTVQTPFDCSVKGLLFEILRKADEAIGSNYYEKAIRARVTTDLLMGSVSQVALNNIGILIIDEIQYVVNSRHGIALVNALTQLINSSGISICLVGTPESRMFFEGAMQLARRSLGLQYDKLPYNQYFQGFCSTLFEYQYTKNKTEITPAIVEWLYEHSSGVISVVVSLIHDAQEIAILNGVEKLNLNTLEEAYKQRLSMIHHYIEPSIKRRAQTNKVKRGSESLKTVEEVKEINEYIRISELVIKSKNEQLDIITLLKQHMTVEEVKV